MPTLTQDLLKELFHYNPDTGVVTRKTQYKNGPKPGSIVGCKKPRGYVMVNIQGKEYRLHRLIYTYMTGNIPDEIDHINGDGFDNRWCNLRSVSHRQNQMNRKIPSGNTSGIMGVWFDNARKKWTAEIMIRQKKKYLGRFSLKKDAAKARAEAEIVYGFHKNHGRAM